MARIIGMVVGSLRRDSFNKQLAHALVKHAPDELTFKMIEIGDLPLYNQDDDAHPHENVTRLKREIESCEAIIFVTPEYNRAMPGVLKNAIDHASRPHGQNRWAGKPAGVLGMSIGATGTSMAQQHLRNTLAYLDMPTLNQPELYLQMKDGLFGADGAIAVESTRKLIEGWLQKFVAWVETHAAHEHSPAGQGNARAASRTGAH